jgi:hypothetical protein
MLTTPGTLWLIGWPKIITNIWCLDRKGSFEGRSLTNGRTNGIYPGRANISAKSIKDSLLYTSYAQRNHNSPQDQHHEYTVMHDGFESPWGGRGEEL